MLSNLMSQKWKEHLREAIRTLKIADHMTYVTFPLIHEKKLLLKIFDEIYKSIINCINAVLDYENIDMNVEKSNNFQVVASKYMTDYLTSEQIKKISEIIELNKKRKESQMEFVRSEKVVMMSNNLNVQTLDLSRIKEYLLLTKELLIKISVKTR